MDPTPGAGADGGLGELLAQMQSLQHHLAEAEASASAREVEGSAGGGAVRVRAAGEISFTSVSIDPSVVDPADVALLEDLVLAAVRDAAAKLLEQRRAAMGAAVNEALGDLLSALPADTGPGELPGEAG